MRNIAAQWKQSQKGQSLVIIAAVMIGLIALMGLAIDGGNLFLQRRRAQNAADAAALAGTRMLAKAIGTCHADPASADQVIAQETNRFAESNGIADTNGVPGDATNTNVVGVYVNKDGTILGQVGAGVLPVGSTGVQVDVRSTHQTYFLTVVGIPNAGAQAEAQARTGVVNQFAGGAGILPFAVHVDVVNAMAAGTQFRALDVLGNNGGRFCSDENGNGQYGDASDACIGDPSPNNAHRGWLNLNFIYNTAHLASDDGLNRTFEVNVPNRGCGSDPNRSTDDGLQGWAEFGACPYPFPMIAGKYHTTGGDFVHGSPGTRQSSLDAVESSFECTSENMSECKIGYAPLFDYVYTSDYMSNHFQAAQVPSSGGDVGRWPTAGGGGSAYLYHVVGFVGMVIRNVDGSGSNHYLDAQFVQSVIGDGVVWPGAGFNPTICLPPQVYGVALWK